MAADVSEGSVHAVEIEYLPGDVLQNGQYLKERIDHIIRSDHNEYGRRTVRAGYVGGENTCI